MAGRLDVSLQSQDYGGSAVIPVQSPGTVGWYTINRNSVTFTASSVNNQFTTPTPNNFVVGTQIWLTSFTGTGPATFTLFYVNSVVSSTNFTISTSPTGTTTAVTASGSGTLTSGLTGVTHTIWLQPQRMGEYWIVRRITVASASTTLVPTAGVYRGVVNPSTLVDQTQAAQQNTDDVNSPIRLSSGEPLIVQFTFVDVPTATGVMTCNAFLGGDVDNDFYTRARVTAEGG